MDNESGALWEQLLACATRGGVDDETTNKVLRAGRAGTATPIPTALALALASHTDDAQTLQELASHADADVRRLVAVNPSTTEATLRILLRYGGSGARVALLDPRIESAFGDEYLIKLNEVRHQYRRAEFGEIAQLRHRPGVAAVLAASSSFQGLSELAAIAPDEVRDAVVARLWAHTPKPGERLHHRVREGSTWNLVAAAMRCGLDGRHVAPRNRTHPALSWFCEPVPYVPVRTNPSTAAEARLEDQAVTAFERIVSWGQHAGGEHLQAIVEMLRSAPFFVFPDQGLLTNPHLDAGQLRQLISHGFPITVDASVLERDDLDDDTLFAVYENLATHGLLDRTSRRAYRQVPVEVTPVWRRVLDARPELRAKAMREIAAVSHAMLRADPPTPELLAQHPVTSLYGARAEVAVSVLTWWSTTLDETALETLLVLVDQYRGSIGEAYETARNLARTPHPRTLLPSHPTVREALTEDIRP